MAYIRRNRLLYPTLHRVWQTWVFVGFQACYFTSLIQAGECCGLPRAPLFPGLCTLAAIADALISTRRVWDLYPRGYRLDNER